ncbi:hypothetical protein Msil_2258 [Methylocella silvestris BL2]|uniref:Uncharacterized protein n=1 Tax=Methylocella silvestris (strain DSM 15510 / CIP 108128 / LMG 27833 / NCIMB 13906 / BL2) TaxID=395965 RepID=B8ET54_METSB|nr:hypothetical protein Msil_2258 [Methylocella silvestris BL2]
MWRARISFLGTVSGFASLVWVTTGAVSVVCVLGLSDLIWFPALAMRFF